MNKDQVKGRVEEAKGKVKEVAGKIVGNRSMEVKGTPTAFDAPDLIDPRFEGVEPIPVPQAQ